jgi:hypothetical protein
MFNAPFVLRQIENFFTEKGYSIVTSPDDTHTNYPITVIPPRNPGELIIIVLSYFP